MSFTVYLFSLATCHKRYLKVTNLLLYFITTFHECKYGDPKYCYKVEYNHCICKHYVQIRQNEVILTITDMNVVQRTFTCEYGNPPVTFVRSRNDQLIMRYKSGKGKSKV